MRTNLHIYPPPLKNEGRILRETKSVINLKLADYVYIAATWAKGLNKEEDITDKIKVYRLKNIFSNLKKGTIWDILRFSAFLWQVIFKFSKKKNRPTIVNCHSLSVLLGGVYFKIFFKSYLIFDAHELETERSGVFGYRKVIAKFLERSLIKKCDKLMVVCDSIGAWYLEHYPFLEGKISVLRNIPDLSGQQEVKNVSLKRELGIPENELLYIYQGAFFKGRGITTLLNAFANMPDKNIVFMGYGPLHELISEFAASHPNIYLKDAVPPAVLLSYTKTADVGISLTEHTCLNHYYALPNKVFEYSMAGVPLIVSNFPEMGGHVKHYKIGWVVTPGSNDLEELLKTIDRKTLDDIKPNFEKVYKEVTWEKEQERLIETYNFN